MRMIDTEDSNALERLLGPLRNEMNANFAAALLRVRADEELQSRYELLAQKNTEGRLSSGELSELAFECIEGRSPRFFAASHHLISF
jgi:hypothetical protein